MAFDSFRGVKSAARLAAALCLPALSGLFGAANAAADPVMLFQASCLNADGATQVFELQGQRLNPTAILMRFVLITPEAPQGRVLASNVISEGELNDNFHHAESGGYLYS